MICVLQIKPYYSTIDVEMKWTPKNVSTKELMEQLLKLKLPTNGSKTVLCTRLEQFISFNE